MSEDVRVALPEMAVQDAARLMAELDIGVLPVCDGGRLVGMVTDRDIAIRGVALGLGPATPVGEVMSPGVRYCRPDDRLDEVIEGMGALQVRRMPVLDGDQRLIGIISLADAGAVMAPAAIEALGRISEPGGEHSQADERDPSGLVEPPARLDDDSAGHGLLHFTDDDPT